MIFSERQDKSAMPRFFYISNGFTKLAEVENVKHDTWPTRSQWRHVSSPSLSQDTDPEYMRAQKKSRQPSRDVFTDAYVSMVNARQTDL